MAINPTHLRPSVFLHCFLFALFSGRTNRVSIVLFLSCIQMKSYLSGNPGLRIALNEDLVIGSDRRGSGGGSYGGSVVLDGELTTTITLREGAGGGL